MEIHMNVIPCEELTWPEIASLPRDMPLILPLGKGYDLSSLENLLGVRDVGILPGIPFGWQGSRLEVQPQIFVELVRRLVYNLVDDGFTNIILLTPGVEMLPEVRTIYLPCPEEPALFDGNADREKVIILPIGHTEQHALHALLLHGYRHHRGGCPGYSAGGSHPGAVPAGLPLRCQHAPSFLPRHV